MQVMCGKAGLLAFTTLLSVAGGLKVSLDTRGNEITNSTRGDSKAVVAGSLRIGRVGTGSAASRRVDLEGTNATEGDFSSCNSTSCKVDATDLQLYTHPSVILFIGSSLDRNAVKHVCETAGAALFSIQWAVTAGVAPLPIQDFQGCTVGDTTLAMVFIPGSGDRTRVPYYNLYSGTQTTAEILVQSRTLVMKHLGMEPAVIVVDASLWDITSWWQHRGEPAPPYITPYVDLRTWIDTDIPHLMTMVRNQFPSSKLAFRTQPPVLENVLGQNDEILGIMATLVRQSMPGGLFLGQYGIIDFNQIVSAKPPPLGPLYIDPIHPGPQLNIQYIAAVVNWGRATP